MQQLVPMLARVASNMGMKPDAASADAGYFSAAAVGDPSLDGINVLAPPERQQQAQVPPPEAASPVDSAAQVMRQRLGVEINVALYRQRKAVVEPVFGQLKERRGIRRFVVRGLEKVSDEWSLICLTHNLLKLFRARSKSLAGAAC